MDAVLIDGVAFNSQEGEDTADQEDGGLIIRVKMGLIFEKIELVLIFSVSISCHDL